MDYERKYKDALERAKESLKDGGISQNSIDYIQSIFPELSESEDEKIRKEIITFIKKRDRSGCDYDYDKWIAWLEKQKSIREIVERCKNSWYNEGKIAGMAEGLTDDEKYQQGWHDALEKQGEQKSIIEMKSPEESLEISSKEYNEIVNDCLYGEQKPADMVEPKDYRSIDPRFFKPVDKVEPKFKVGDWVIDSQGIVHQIGNVIENVTNRTYGYDIVGGGYFNDNTEGVRLWTIKDAKDGDVLAGKIDGDDYILIFKQIKDGWIETYGHYYNAVDRFCVPSQLFSRDYKGTFHPATKEQRDILERAMTNAGYRWNKEELKLEKI